MNTLNFPRFCTKPQIIMTYLYAFLFLLPFILIPLLCAWLYQRKKLISHTQSYVFNGLLVAVLPVVWHLFQDPVQISNQVPVLSSASIMFLCNIVFGVPTSLINQILMNFLLAPNRTENQAMGNSQALA